MFSALQVYRLTELSPQEMGPQSVTGGGGRTPAAAKALYQVALIEVRKSLVGAHLRVRPLVGGHI